MSADATLRAIGAGGTNATVRRILATFDRHTDTDLESGARWYGDDSLAILATMVEAGCPTMEHAAAVVSHLSPRTTWSRNVAAALAMVTSGPDGARHVGAMRDNVRRAEIALHSDAPLDTFGPTAHKTRSFARNLLGDREAVTVDVWAARVAFGDTVESYERALNRVGVYDAVAHAYRLAARRRGVDAQTMQATAWIVARNGRAA